MSAGLRVRVAMAYKGWSINALAGASGVSHFTAQALANNRTATTFQTLLAVAQALEVSIEWLAEGRNPPMWLVDLIDAPEPARVA